MLFTGNERAGFNDLFSYFLIKKIKTEKMKRKAKAHWKGTGKEGTGTLNGPSGVLDDTPYSAKLRFENEDGKKGTNPEELIAAAHSGCFSMALAFAIEEEGHEAEYLDVEAMTHVDKEGDGYAFKQIKLKLKGKVPGMDKAKFEELANGAKENCPVSKALSAVPISLETEFVTG